MESKHKKLKLEDERIRDENGYAICNPFWAKSIPYRQQLETAQELVRRWNAHEDLVEALKKIWEGCGDSWEGQIARAAILKATEGSR